MRDPRDDWQGDATSFNPFMLGCLVPILGALLTLMSMCGASSGGKDSEALFWGLVYTGVASLVGLAVLLIVFRRHAQRHKAFIIAIVIAIVLTLASLATGHWPI